MGTFSAFFGQNRVDLQPARLVRRQTSLALYLTSSRSSLTFGGAIQASARRPSRSRSARSSASRVSFFTRRLPQLLPSGMGQVDLAAELFEQVGRPVPPVARFKDNLGVLAGGGHRPFEGEQVVVVDLGSPRGSRPRRCAGRSRSGVCAGRYRRTAWGCILVLLRRGVIGLATPSVVALGSP